MECGSVLARLEEAGDHEYAASDGIAMLNGPTVKAWVRNAISTT